MFICVVPRDDISLSFQKYSFAICDCMKPDETTAKPIQQSNKGSVPARWRQYVILLVGNLV